MAKYIGLVVGPVFGIINSGQRTRMLWGGSYFFSYVIRELTKLLANSDENQSRETRISGDVILPATMVNAQGAIPAWSIYNDKGRFGAGKFADKILLKAGAGDFEKVQLAISLLTKDIAAKIAAHITNTQGNGQVTDDEVETLLNDYLQFYFVEREIEEEGNFHKPIYNDLDVAELRNNYIADERVNYLHRFLFRVNKLKNNSPSFLLQDAFNGEEGDRKRFLSLIEIATAGLSMADLQAVYQNLVEQHIVSNLRAEDGNLVEKPEQEDERDEGDQESFLSELKNAAGDKFKAYHKYVAVLRADGDKIGATLKSIGGDVAALKTFSGKLLHFNMLAEEIVRNYGGASVYLGGDDIVVFAPLAVPSGKVGLKTIFHLMDELDKAFNSGGLFDKAYAEELKVPIPTLSFGVSAAFYKYPLAESMRLARNLEHLAKEERPIDSKNEEAGKLLWAKNSIAFRLQKHSGQYFEMTLRKEFRNSYEAFHSLLDALAGPAQENVQMINSVTHRLKDPIFKTTILYIAGVIETNPQKGKMMLKNFIDNSFDESIHKKTSVQAYLKKLQDFMFSTICDYQQEAQWKRGAGTYKEEEDDSLKVIYSSLRFIDFLNKNDDDQ